MDASQISRLKEEQQRAVTETEDKIKQFEKFKSDYQALQKRLKTLPDKLSHDVMVPFGKLAFMPGQIVHTNEVMVLLGDNWFAEQSAKQAIDIAGRRIKELDIRIQNLKEQQKLLEPRLDITSELQAQAEGKGNYQEIVEEYDEEKERMWDEQHRINVRQYHENLRKEKESTKNQEKKDDGSVKEAAVLKSDEDFWSRLEALEKQEAERGELNSSFESDDDVGGNDERGTIGEDENAQLLGRMSASKKKRVSWVDESGRMDENAPDSDEDSDDEDGDYDNDEEDEEDDDGERSTKKPVIKTINFSHSKTQVAIQSHDNLISVSKGTTEITSPADIYKLFSPKSILKNPSSKSDSKAGLYGVTSSSGDYFHSSLPSYVAGEEAKNSADESRKAEITTSRDKAFTGIVKETPKTDVACPPPSTSSSACQEPKRVSKFKAQRMNQKPSS